MANTQNIYDRVAAAVAAGKPYLPFYAFVMLAATHGDNGPAAHIAAIFPTEGNAHTADLVLRSRLKSQFKLNDIASAIITSRISTSNADSVLVVTLPYPPETPSQGVDTQRKWMEQIYTFNMDLLEFAD